MGQFRVRECNRIVDGSQMEMIENEIANDSSVDHSRRNS